MSAALLPTCTCAQGVEHPFSFSLLPGALPQLVHPRFAWGDVDRDGDLDLLAIGTRADGAARRPYTALLRNDGRVPHVLAPGGMTMQFTPIDLPHTLAHGDLDLADIDRDGDLDLVLTGSATHRPPYQPQTHLYQNDGTGTFTDTGIALPAVFGGAVRLADIDGDGDLDVVLTGASESAAPYTPTARVLRQTAAWTFLDVGASGLTGHAFGEARMIDADGDGDVDVFLGGLTSEGLATRLHVNDGTGAFKASPLALAGGIQARVGATRSNGRLDVVAMGGVPARIGFEVRGSHVSDGTPLPITPRMGGIVAWTDWDDDGDSDLIVGGTLRLNGTTETILLRRDDAGRFDLAGSLAPVDEGTSSLADMDGDGDLDIAVSGLLPANTVIGALYRNDRWGNTTTPSQPRGLVAHAEYGGVRLRWDATPGATYELRAGSSPSGIDIAAPASAADGRRRVARPGALSEPTVWLSPDFLAGHPTVYVGVQAVSGRFAGSSFAEIAVPGVPQTTSDAVARPTAWGLSSPVPTPLTGTGSVRVDAPADGDVELTLLDALGRTVARLHHGRMAAGTHRVSIDVASFSTGLYALRLRTPAGIFTRSLLVAR